MNKTALILALSLTAAFNTSPEADAQDHNLQSGEVYREYTLHNSGNFDWRVTATDVKREDAKKFLPNPVLELAIEDLEHAVRAEVLLDRWGGHKGTKDKQIRFNGNQWISVPELQTTPPGKHHPADYLSQDNPIVPVPLEYLKKGANIVEGGIGPGNAGHWWGQWGLYSVILRVYYAPPQKEHATGSIVGPLPNETLGENPEIKIECSTNTTQVEVLAWYDGYDENGDGVFRDWHRSYFQPNRGEAAEIRGHVGTLREEPWAITWNTRYVPDQESGTVRLIARIKHSNGIWTVTDVVSGLSLVRKGIQVKQYRASKVPHGFGVRIGRTKSCLLPIPDGDRLEDAVEAVLHYRTWNGTDETHAPFKFNDFSHKNKGKNHHYCYGQIPVDVQELKHENTFSVHSETEHHELEVLWPGPALTVRYSKATE